VIRNLIKKGLLVIAADGRVVATELEVSGIDGITVHRVTGSVDRQVSGLGRINVRNRR
jgi:hypothetical protein